MSQRRKNILAAMLGNALEYYDFTLYGFFAAFLSPLFFPSEDPKISIIASFGAFAAGFLMRPVGGLIFGHLGDKYGRKKALVISIMAMAMPTLTIGIMPTYQQIGFIAPVLVVLSRLAQGICTAGEYTGAVVLTAEYSKNNQPGFACSLLPTSSLVGAVAGTLMGALFLSDMMPEWAWRIPFIIGFAFGICAIIIRTTLQESPEFMEQLKKKRTQTVPILEVFRSHKWNFFCATGVGATAIAPFYIIFVYVVSQSSELGLTPSQTMAMNMGVLLIWMMFIPFIGYLSDKIGIRRTMSYGTILLTCASIPMFIYLNENLTIGRVITTQIVLSFSGAFFVAPMGAFLTSIFPTSSRYSGIALGLSFGEALLGGTAPLMAASLVLFTGETSAPGFYLAFCAICGFLAINLAKSIGSTDSGESSYQNGITLIPKLNFQSPRKILQ